MVLAGGALVAFVVAMVGLVVASALSGGSHALTIAEEQRYEAAAVEPIKAGGEVVQLGLKVAIGDLGSEHKTAPAVIARQSQGWQRDLATSRRTLAGVEPPAELRDAHRDFLRALDGYIATARLIERATASSGADLDHLLDQVAASGAAADRTFDRGSAVLQRARHDLGLQPSPDFPTP